MDFRPERLELDELLASIPRLPTQEIESLLNQTNSQLRQLRQDFPESEEISYSGPLSVEEIAGDPLARLSALERLRDRLMSERAARSPESKGRPYRKDLLAGEPDVVRRRKSINDNPRMTTVSLCKQFDLDQIPFPDDWKLEPGVKSWADAYRNEKLRRRIYTIVSKARRFLKEG